MAVRPRSIKTASWKASKATKNSSAFCGIRSVDFPIPIFKQGNPLFGLSCRSLPARDRRGRAKLSGPEVKYQPRYVLADATGGRTPDFLWRPKRLRKIRAITSDRYPAAKSRHRGVLYNDFIERIIDTRQTREEKAILRAPDGFLFPHIL